MPTMDELRKRLLQRITEDMASNPEAAELYGGLAQTLENSVAETKIVRTSPKPKEVPKLKLVYRLQAWSLRNKAIPRFCSTCGFMIAAGHVCEKRSELTQIVRGDVAEMIRQKVRNDDAARNDPRNQHYLDE